MEEILGKMTEAYGNQRFLWTSRPEPITSRYNSLRGLESRHTDRNSHKLSCMRNVMPLSSNSPRFTASPHIHRSGVYGRHSNLEQRRSVC